jgi:hypothetical protein
MGYYRPVSQFNPGKKSEFYSRKNFSPNYFFIKQYGWTSLSDGVNKPH